MNKYLFPVKLLFRTKLFSFKGLRNELHIIRSEISSIYLYTEITQLDKKKVEKYRSQYRSSEMYPNT